MNITIRQEKGSDHKAVFQIIEKAFKTVEYSDPKEQFLVEKLRKSNAFIPELSLIAEVDNTIVGHILLTKISINNEIQKVNSLALAPVSVLPNFQKKGIGGMLIQESHRIAKQLNYQSIVVLGHSSYYPKFGYVRADNFGIVLPFDVPKEYCMVLELTKNSLKNVDGMVEYPKEFNE